MYKPLSLKKCEERMKEIRKQPRESYKPKKERFKDYEPIKFEILQTDMEKLMYQINEVLNERIDMIQWALIQGELQHKIDKHRERGEWV